jgi:hypothetical protein
MITRLYTLFLGLLLVLFVGVGIAAFFPAPAMPDSPIVSTGSDVKDPTFQSEADRKYQEQMRVYEAARKNYDRNVSLLLLGGAIIFVLLGLTTLRNLPIINDSLLLGGVFTLVYSIMRGFGAGDDAFRFMLVTASLAVAVALGYMKLIRPMQHDTGNKKSK